MTTQEAFQFDDKSAGTCTLCPRLVEFRKSNRVENPRWHNDFVPAFGSNDARILIVGLAPGKKGANRTGRVFTGDKAGDVLFYALYDVGLSRGYYRGRIDDGVELRDCVITNAVRCVPPENKPLPEEVATCRQFLLAQIEAMPNLAVIFSLGGLAHQSVIAALGKKQKDYPFGHGKEYLIGGRVIMSSYHCSQRNISTKIMTGKMLCEALERAIFLADERGRTAA